MTITENNIESFRLLKKRNYNTSSKLMKQAKELKEQNCQYVLNGYCGNGISNIVLFNPSAEQVKEYMSNHSMFYSSYYFEIAYSKN